MLASLGGYGWSRRGTGDERGVGGQNVEEGRRGRLGAFMAAAVPPPHQERSAAGGELVPPVGRCCCLGCDKALIG